MGESQVAPPFLSPLLQRHESKSRRSNTGWREQSVGPIGPVETATKKNGLISSAFRESKKKRLSFVFR